MTLLVWLAGSSLLWGAVLWGAALALQSGNDLSGRARQWIWRGAAALLIAPWLAVPVVGLLAPELSGSLTPPAASEDPLLAEPVATMAATDLGVVAMTEPARESLALPWLEIALAAIIGGWLVRITAARLAGLRLGKLVAASRRGDGIALVSLNAWSRRLGLRMTPELRVMTANMPPFSTGIRRPIICLPEGIERGMAADTLDLVVGHECIHVARGDGWRRPLERVIADVMWFNPFAWAIRRELDLARELACDEAVVEASSARRAYARTLRDVAGMTAGLARSAPAASMSLSGGGRLLAMRMKRTLDVAARRPAKAALAGAVMLAIAGAPMAIAQAILIEAAQPQEAPPAPPAPPLAGAYAIAPQAPVPPVPPKQVKISPDGTVRIDFPARVMETGGSADKGYRVTLLQTSKNSQGEVCGAKLDGLSRIDVVKDQTLAKGAVIGERGRSGSFSVGVTCSDETDASGWPKAAVNAPAPPVPPTPPAPLDAVAPAAPISLPTPRTVATAITPVTPLTAVTPRPMPAPRAAPTAITPVTPVTPGPTPPRAAPAPQVAPTPGAIPAPPAPPAALTPIQFVPGGSEPVLEGQARRTSGFGYRVDPFTTISQFHPGVDLAQKVDSPVRAPASGVVTFAGINAETGMMVEVSFANNVRLRFGHLNRIDVEVGDQVKPGQLIGVMGNTGPGTGPHLHLEVLRNGEHVDPETVEGLRLFGG